MIWVHLTYQTAFVDDAGKLQMRRDVYNLDSRTLAAIKSERGDLETAPDRKREEIAGSSPRKPAAPTRTGSSSDADLPVGVPAWFPIQIDVSMAVLVTAIDAFRPRTAGRLRSADPVSKI